MVFVSVWTTGTSFVEISRFSPPVETLLKLIVSVFTTGDCVNKKKKGIGKFSKASGFLRKVFFIIIIFYGKRRGNYKKCSAF